MSHKKEKLSLNVTLKKGATLHAGEGVKLKQIASERLTFQGDPLSPLLAPRGICYDGKHLIVTDTGQNRIFIWHALPNQIMQEPDLILGQQDAVLTGRNAGGNVSQGTLHYPSGIWSDGHHLVVADAWNHRVLVWHSFPTSNGQPADVVIGQPDFLSNAPNVHGIGKPPQANTLNWPYGVFVHDGQLFIADTGNRRVLVYNTIPTSNFAKADHVIGKSGFDDRDYSHEDAIWPYAVKVSKSGQMAITDTQYYRVLLWNNWKTALDRKADAIIGQPDFESNGQNQYGLFPDAHTLNWCYDCHFYKDGFLVADTGNSRLLHFDTFPDHHNPKADHLIGKPNFNTSSEFSDTVFGTEKSLYWPFSLSIDEDNKLLILADTGNHRILFFDLLI